MNHLCAASRRTTVLGINIRFYSQLTSLDKRIEALQPGLILFKDCLSLEKQIQICSWIQERGNDPKKGFWKIDENGSKVLNQAPNAPHRGRIFDECPPFLADDCLRVSTLASQVDIAIKPCFPTHYLLLIYQVLEKTPRYGYIPWHQDKDPNDGDENEPVVFFSFGATRELLVCNEKPSLSPEHPPSNPKNLVHRIKLDSGDALFVGGPSRHMHHAVYTIQHNVPSSLQHFFPARKAYSYSLTFRRATQIKTSDYETGAFKSVYGKDKKEQASPKPSPQEIFEANRFMKHPIPGWTERYIVIDDHPDEKNSKQ